MYLGFTLSAYSAVSNDSIQTLGTLFHCTTEFRWWTIWIFLSIVFLATTISSYVLQDHDISFERLRSKGFEKDPVSFSQVQMIAPVILMFITRIRMPVSTSFLLLGLFAEKSSDFMKVVTKSFLGYGIAFGVCIGFYGILQRWKIKELIVAEDTSMIPYIFEFGASAFLWSSWLMQDMSNIAIYLKRQLEW